MTRKKVKLVWIVNDNARKASLKKRRVGLLKKVNELTTLCGINAFVIIFSPDDNEPAVWPSRPVVQQLMARFQSMPEMERSKKMVNQETYLKERVVKVQDQLKKLHRKNKEVEVANLMHQIYQGKALNEFHTSELHGLVWLVEEKMKEIRKRVEFFQQVPLPPGSLPPQGPAPAENMRRIGSSGGDGKTTTNVSFDQWFLDMMNNTENIIGSSSVKSNIGQPHNTYVGSSSVAHGSVFGGQSGGSGMGLPHRTFRGHTHGSDMGLLSRGNTRGSSGANIMGLGLGMQPPKNIGGSNNANDPQPYGIGGVSTDGSEMGLSFGLFGGNSGGSDIELPFDITKTNWPNNYSP